MSSRIDLRPYVRTRVDHVTSLVLQPTNAFTMEDFHGLRVDIKQLRAALKYLRVTYPEFQYNRRYAAFKEVFRQAGHIRELLLHLQYMKPHRDVSGLDIYLAKLHRQIEKEFVSFLHLATSAWTKKIQRCRKKIDPFLSQVDVKKTKRYLKHLRKRIRKSLQSKKLCQEDVHLIRADIKELYYLEKAFNQDQAYLKVADDFQELIGTWHDHTVVVSQLQKQIRKASKNAEITSSLRTIRSLIRQQENQLFQQILLNRSAYLETIQQS